MRHNRLRALLTADEPSIGTHLLSSWPTLVELVGDAGNYDYVEFSAEYAPFNMHDLDNLGPRAGAEEPRRHDQDRADPVDPPGNARDRLRLPKRAVRRPAHRRRCGGMRRSRAR